MKPKAPGRLRPENALPCVWMSAGLLAYRLCDRDYDCDSCPLDRALRGPDRPRRPATVEAPWEFRDDRRYDPRHLWAAVTGGDRVRCGLDAFAARVLPRAHAVILPTPGSRVRRGQAGCWTVDGAETIPLCCPVSGAVARRNARLHDRASLLREAPYDKGWLFEVRPDPPFDEQSLLSAAEAERRASAQTHRLQREVATFLARRRKGVGETMADGGRPLTDLPDIFGADRYRRLILRFLT